MLVGRCFIVSKLGVDEDEDPELVGRCLQARSDEDERDPQLSRHRHRRGRTGRFPQGKQQIVCLWRSLSSALEKDTLVKSHIILAPDRTNFLNRNMEKLL